MFTKQSYWHKLRGLLFKLKAILLVQTAQAFVPNLGARWLFSSPAGFCWVHIDWLAPGHPMGAGNPTISRETETQVPAACQRQPRHPHIIKLISQLQKPTRRITDTWIIDTGKRETRYQIVKVHQTIQQPHSGKMTNPHWVFRCFSFLSVSEINTSYWICRVCHLTFVHCIQNDIILMNMYKRNKKFWFSQSQWSSYEDNYTLSQSKYILHYYPHWFESLRYLSISISVYTYIF